MSKFKNWMSRAGSSALLMSWIVTALRLGNVLLILPLMLRTLASEELGLWFLLLNFTQFSTLVEMGFQSTIARSIGYFRAGVREVSRHGIVSAAVLDPGPNWDGMAGLLQTARKIYHGLAVLGLILAAGGGGAWLAITRPAEFLHPRALVTFGLLCLAGPLALAGLHWNAFLLGLNRVREAQIIQLRALLVNYALAGIGLAAGYGMLALAFAQVAMVLLSRWESRRVVRRGFPEILAKPRTPAVPSQVLWPMAWRTGLTMLAGYLSIQASLLICGQVLDLATTASFGLSLQIGLLLHGVSSSWLQVKYPLLAEWLAAGRLAEVRTLLRSRLAAAVTMYLIGAAGALLLAPWALHLIGSKTPVLPTCVLTGLFGAIGLELVASLHGAVILTANRAAHLPNVLVAAAVNLGLGWWLAHRMGPLGLALAMAAACALLHLWRTPWLCWSLLKNR